MKEATESQIINQKVGRPAFIMTDNILSKLREAFVQGLTDEEACLYVGISGNFMTFVMKMRSFVRTKSYSRIQ